MGFCIKTRRGNGSNRSAVPMPFVFTGNCEAIDRLNFKLLGTGNIKFLRDLTLTVRCVGASNDPDAPGVTRSGVRVLASARTDNYSVFVGHAHENQGEMTDAYFWPNVYGGGEKMAEYPGYIILTVEAEG